MKQEAETGSDRFGTAGDWEVSEWRGREGGCQGGDWEGELGGLEESMKLGCTLFSGSQESSSKLSISHRYTGKLALVCGLKVDTRGAKTAPAASFPRPWTE